MLKVGVVTRTKRYRDIGDDEELPWMKKTSYTRLMIFSKGLIIAAVTIFS
jgi:hypothetical protein